ncbi:hypothetical protein LIX60_14835 [Streptomyces sp. S07_1.15]|uniref:hypothetical protein n=1 Tax=Streptomyces sp. S07_1.15 TaxID=2873925 RepID=UPI001D14CB2A|nr:hypothetical protein [Streptomyces sp. S07_1.15]MCC3652714.1 hypothetical protein [Streptomyces sp. S07_1.15]
MNARDIPAPVRELLAALADAVDLPLPDITDADERRAGYVLRDRARSAVVVARTVLDNGHDPAHAAAYLRRRTAETPADYQPWRGPLNGGEGR